MSVTLPASTIPPLFYPQVTLTLTSIHLSTLPFDLRYQFLCLIPYLWLCHVYDFPFYSCRYYGRLPNPHDVYDRKKDFFTPATLSFYSLVPYTYCDIYVSLSFRWFFFANIHFRDVRPFPKLPPARWLGETFFCSFSFSPFFPFSPLARPTNYRFPLPCLFLFRDEYLENFSAVI